MKRCTLKRLWLPACGVISIAALTMILTGTPVVEGKDLPGVVVIKQLQNRYGPVTFDHRRHAAMTSCGKCHHTHSPKAYGLCTDCHSQNPELFQATANHGFVPCGECHKDFSPEKPEIPGLKVALHRKCFECHVGIGDLGSSPGGCVRTCHARK